MPINCVYYTPEIRVYKNGDFERIDKTTKKWTKYVPQYGVLESSKKKISIKGASFTRKSIYNFCYNIDKENVNRLSSKAKMSFKRLNKF